MDILDSPDFLGSQALQMDYLSAADGWNELGKGNPQAWADHCHTYSIKVPWHNLFTDAEGHGLQIHELTAFVKLTPGYHQFKVIDLTPGPAIRWECFEACPACEDERNK